MRFVVLVNDVGEVAATHSTSMLIEAAARRGHEVCVCAVADLSLCPGDRVEGRVRVVDSPPRDRGTMLAWLVESPTRRVVMADCDAMLIRINPIQERGRSWAHEVALELARIVQDQGVLVLNDPDGLARAASKLYLAYLPESLRPRTLVSHDRDQLLTFINDLPGPCVLKPLRGARGWKVFLIHPDESANLYQIIDVVLRDGFAMAQEFLPEALTEGDVRLLLLDGKLVEIDGRVAGIRRVPRSRDFRTNLTAGGTAQPVEVTEPMRRAAELIGPRLARDGLFMTGLDLIGGRVVEVNVFTTGGLFDAQRFSGVDFADEMIAEIERKLT